MNTEDQILTHLRDYDFSKPKIQPTSTSEEICFDIEVGEILLEVKAKVLFTPTAADPDSGISAGFDFLEVDEIDINLPDIFITPLFRDKIEKLIQENYRPDIY